MASLDDVDLSAKLSKKEGKLRLNGAQKRLLELRLQVGGQLGDGELGPPVCVVFEGWDASGKGGAIKRLVSKLDSRHVTVAEFAVPDERERRHHFLWRFGPALPGWGGMSVLDRSWYGRVLVERVEGFASEAEWERAYDEIVAFERGLCVEGTVLVKFWLHLSDEEQLRRFRRREREPLKSWTSRTPLLRSCARCRQSRSIAGWLGRGSSARSHAPTDPATGQTTAAHAGIHW